MATSRALTIGRGAQPPERERSGEPGRGRRFRTLLFSLLASTLLVVPLGLLAGSSVASATTPAPATCTGPLAAGTYSSVTVSGTCQISAGQVVVTGDVTVPAGANSLLASYALNGGVAATSSGLTVAGEHHGG